MAHNHNNEEAKAGQSQALCQPKSCNIPVSALLQSSVIKCHKMGLFLVSLPPPALVSDYSATIYLSR